MKGVVCLERFLCLFSFPLKKLSVFLATPRETVNFLNGFVSMSTTNPVDLTIAKKQNKSS